MFTETRLVINNWLLDNCGILGHAGLHVQTSHRMFDCISIHNVYIRIGPVDIHNTRCEVDTCDSRLTRQVLLTNLEKIRQRLQGCGVGICSAFHLFEKKKKQTRHSASSTSKLWLLCILRYVLKYLMFRRHCQRESNIVLNNCTVYYNNSTPFLCEKFTHCQLSSPQRKIF